MRQKNALKKLKKKFEKNFVYLLHCLVSFLGQDAEVLIEETEDETEYCELVDTILIVCSF